MPARSIPAVNATDRAEALGKGYVVIVTDTGHTGNGTDANWVVTAGRQARHGEDHRFLLSRRARRHRRRQAVRAGLLCRSGAARLFRRVLYRRPHGDDGGRALPHRLRRHHRRRSQPRLQLHHAARSVVQKAALASPAAYIPQSLLAAIDKRVTGRCDAIDGATDGLVQNPARCPIRAEDLVCQIRRDRRLPDAGASRRAARLHDAVARPARPSAVSGLARSPISPARAASAIGPPGDTAPNVAQRESPWGSDPAAPPRGWDVRARGADLLARPWPRREDGDGRRRCAQQHGRRQTGGDGGPYLRPGR